jgi:hypothetical protein
LGSGRHTCCRGRRRYTDANAHCYSDSDRYSNGQRHGYSDSDCHANGQPYCNGVGNCYAATDANTEVGAIRKAAPHASAEAIDFTRGKISGDRSPVLSSSVEEIDDRMPHVPRFLECWHVASTPRAMTSSKSEFVPESQNSVDTISVI